MERRPNVDTQPGRGDGEGKEKLTSRQRQTLRWRTLRLKAGLHTVGGRGGGGAAVNAGQVEVRARWLKQVGTSEGIWWTGGKQQVGPYKCRGQRRWGHVHTGQTGQTGQNVQEQDRTHDRESASKERRSRGRVIGRWEKKKITWESAQLVGSSLTCFTAVSC